MNEQSKYRLYASRNLTVPDGVTYSLIPTHGRYILALTDKKPNDEFTLVPEGTPLTDEESAWKVRCAVEINSRYLQENEQEYAEVFGAFCDTLEKELAEEKKKLTDSTAYDKKGTDDNA